MNADKLDKLIWTLIYGGLIAVGIGVATQRTDGAVGWVLVAGGAVVSVAGAVLIYVRSRVGDPQGDKP